MGSGAYTVHVHSDRQQLAKTLAEHVATHLRRAIEERDEAVLAVSGGRTPLAFFGELRAQSLPWHRVTVTLVDERCVPHDHPRSNTAFVRTHLLQNLAAAARFVSPVTATGEAKLHLKLPSRVDIAHFGMGSDGHTASWFPQATALSAALAEDGPDLLELAAPGAPEPRVTFTWAALKTSRSAVLHFEGDAKAAVFEQACQPGAMPLLPVRRLLHQADLPLHVFTDSHTAEVAS